MWRVTAVFDGCAPCEPRLERLDAPVPSSQSDGGRRAECVDDVVLDAGHDVHLAWRITRVGAARIEAAYDFDEVYASVHPESVDLEHLRLWHGVLCAKIFDDGDIVLDETGLVQSLRWKSVRKKASRLKRDGTRH